MQIQPPDPTFRIRKTMEDEKQEIDGEPLQVNPGYPLFQIAKALITEEQHEDAAIRARAGTKIKKWITVLNGILQGTLKVGSRSPRADTPVWATLEVVTGGFATGELLAAGALQDHERALLKEKFSAATEADARRILNGYYLTDEGLRELQSLAQSGCYDVTIPEEGALLVIAWLVQHGHTQQARNLLEELAPWFDKLRFYPITTQRPRRFGTRVFLQNVAATMESLKKLPANQRILAQKEAIYVWTPIYDRMVSLFLETVTGEIPYLHCDADGKWQPGENGAFPVKGGWPCQHYPIGWATRAQQLLDDYEKQRKAHKLCGKPEREKNSFAQLRGYLRRSIAQPQSLNGRDVGRIRMILARYAHKHGTPDSTARQQLREKQLKQAGGATFKELAQVLIPRLAAHPGDSGIDEIATITQPVTETEAKKWGIIAGSAIPLSLQQKVERCVSETVAVLVERKIITSGETLARVLPQMTATIRAAGITDATLRHLYAAIYAAFRRRRSLLLLNLEQQVQLEELPWVAAIDRLRQADISVQELARQTLAEVATLTITAFPHMIIPNKLLQELRALAKTAELTLPLVDEVAADIFMGEFSGKFLAAAKSAAAVLAHTLYATYYGIDYQQVLGIEELKPVKRSWLQKKERVDPFMQLCEMRAGISYTGWKPAINGMIIEQQQILTSQNLAVLVAGLDLRHMLRDNLYTLAEHCFSWICRRLQMKTDRWHARLIQVKNSAYAWRQMVFFLALLPENRVADFLLWAENHLNAQPAAFQQRFRPALKGLMAATGQAMDSELAVGAERFLGWSDKKHWLLVE